eukprot:Selendium_serpulae@DN5834_c1_g1_i1.p1
MCAPPAASHRASDTRAPRRPVPFVVFLSSLFVGWLSGSGVVALRPTQWAAPNNATGGGGLGHAGDGSDDAPEAWVVIYHQFKDRQYDTIHLMRSYMMFHNEEVYSKVLFVWDSSQDDALEHLLRYVPAHLAEYVIWVDLSTETDLKRRFERHQMRNDCFGRGLKYCEQLFVKMNLDVAVVAAAARLGVAPPRVMGIADGDTIWMTLPVRGNVIDAAGRLLVHVYDGGPVEARYAPGVRELLKTDSFYNGMVAFPYHVWLDSLGRMRDKILELHGGAEGGGERRSFFQIYANTSHPVCEFCVMATHALLFEPQRYRFIIRPRREGVSQFSNFLSADGALPDALFEAASNAFRDASNASLPMVLTMKHQKAKRPTCPDCLVYGCCVTHRLAAPEAPICADTSAARNFHLTTVESRPAGLTGLRSPTLLTDHYERVWAAMARREASVNERSREECVRYIKAIRRSSGGFAAHMMQPLAAIAVLVVGGVLLHLGKCTRRPAQCLALTLQLIDLSRDAQRDKGPAE